MPRIAWYVVLLVGMAPAQQPDFNKVQIKVTKVALAADYADERGSEERKSELRSQKQKRRIRVVFE